MDKVLFSKQTEFYARDIEEICGVKRARLQTWIERLWIVPSIYKARGKGENNKFDAFDLITISVFKTCIENGLLRSAAADFLKEVHRSLKARSFKIGWEKGHPIYVFFLRRDGKVTDAVMRNYGGDEGLDFSAVFAADADDIFAVNLSKIVRNIKNKLKQ